MKPLLTPEGKSFVDKLTWRPLWICWSLSQASEPPDLLEMSTQTKRVVETEEMLWFSRAKEMERFRRLDRRVEREA
jgi:hypothetical protein